MTDETVIERPKAKGKPKFEFDPVRAAEAAKSLIESIRAVAGDEDDDLIADMVEGETELFDILDALVARRNSNATFVDALEAHIEALKDRKTRYEKRIDFDKALIEQALAIAGLPKVERPCATLSMSQRAAKLIVDDEATIPVAFWKAGDPKLDRTALAEAVKRRDAERETRLAEWRAEHGEDAPAPNDLPPEIPGAHFETPAPSLTVRFR